MEKLIVIYCVLILCIVFAILGLLLKDEKTKIGKMKGKLILTCVSLIAGLILHLNYMVLPWARQQKGELVAFTNFGVLAFVFSLLVLCLFNNFFAAKAKHIAQGNVVLKKASSS